MRKNRVFNFIILLTLLLLTGCSSIFERPSYITYIYTDAIYGIMEKGKINRMSLPYKNSSKMDTIICKKYGINFLTKYNRFYAPKIANKDYDRRTQFAQKQYILFFDDIKLIIGDKEYIVPKEDISEVMGNDGPYYIYPAPVKLEYSRYNDVIIDLGEIEIYDENGKIQRKRRKIPPVLIKKLYYTVRCNNFMCTSKDTLYDGWAEDYPEELKKLQGIKD